jgi:mannose-6-phosphate isomerase-like protein (cupin superfamily)
MNIFVDIDNTICNTKGNEYENSVPIIENINKINKLYNEGNNIVYWTARGQQSKKDHTELTKKQLNDWGCKYHELRLDKPSFDILIDDKTINPLQYFVKEEKTKKLEGQKVIKNWGYEYVIVNNDKYCGKILHFEVGKKFSMHFHIIKKETWFVHSGKFRFRWIETSNADIQEEILEPGHVITNEIGQPHQIECLETGDIFEISTQHFDDDSYRVLKGDNQKNII